MPRFGLDRRRRNALLLIALVAFWFAQAMAVAHASRHAGGDAAGLPGDRAQFCTDCVSMLPLLAVAGGLGARGSFRTSRDSVGACSGRDPSSRDRRSLRVSIARSPSMTTTSGR
jgi:hypothetical protein